MEINYSPYNSRHDIYFFRRGYEKKTKSKKDEHQKQIINIYENWRQSLISVVTNESLDGIFYQSIDLTTLDSSKRYVNIIGKVIPNIKEQKNETARAWAMSHLNCKENKKAYDNYLKIVEYQVNFNKNMKEFLNSTITHLIQIIQSNDDKKLNTLLKDYLSNIVYVYNSNKDTYTEYQIKYLTNNDFSNLFPEKLEELKEDIKSRGQNIINIINGLKDKINNINTSISNFQELLESIIDRSHTQLKGVCPIEKQFGLLDRLRYYSYNH
jgi:hypothetical protein